MTLLINAAEAVVTKVEMRSSGPQNLGWFVALDFGISFGGWIEKPGFEVGDRVCIILEKVQANAVSASFWKRCKPMPFEIKWIDSGREPQCPPDPAFPHGRDIEIVGQGPTCKVELPYPAARCGYYLVVCETCSGNALITTAGRPDDPRSVTLVCKARMKA